MSKTFEQGKAEAAALCDYFAKNRIEFRGRKEAQVRQDLIDRFFRSLGWDVGNAARVAPQYCEVVVEDTLDVEGQQKAPDYAFRVGTLPKFYAEAKKVGVNIFVDPAPAYQLRRYGWSAKVAVSILTDFEELGVYDCTIRPRPNDKASRARILYYRFDEYPDRWRELWDIFSREAVWAGAFDQYTASKRKRGTSEVDVEFLKEIEGWRDELARNTAIRNSKLSSDELNCAVQLTIDRIVFLRMAEDRGLEPYDQLLTLCEQEGVYEGFMKLCRRADDKYNSGLFHFLKEAGVSEAPDGITPRLAVDDKVFKHILQSLYFAHGSPYEFKVMPVEILGTVYERFLGKVIRLTAGHQAKVEEKPEVRKAGGVYYTPAYVAGYIIRQTVGRKIEGKNPAQLAGKGKAQPFRVLDMACGSGSFLLAAFQCLLDHCLKWYIDNGPEGFPKAVYAAREGDWRLTIAEKKRILLSHIFGVDIDPQAVEVCKLSLLLKVLEGESAETVGRQLKLFHLQRMLPNLSDNIKCGNSLIGPDYFDDDLFEDGAELGRVNPFKWSDRFSKVIQSGGFDCVVGNPPYLFITEVLEADRKYYQSKYETVSYRFDLYGAFIEKAVKTLLRSKGLFGFIIPHTLLSNDSFQALRSLLAKNTHVYHVVDLGPGVFQEAKNETMLLFFQNSLPVAGDTVEVVRTTPKDFGKRSESFTVSQSIWARTDGQAWLVRASDSALTVLDRMAKHPKRLADFCTANQGLRTGDNDKYLDAAKRGKTWQPAAGGKNIGRYCPIPTGLYVRYEPALLDAPRSPAIFTAKEKIVVQEIRNISLRRRIVATLDTARMFCLQSTNVVNLKKPDNGPDIRYLLAVLNSAAVNYFFRCRFPGNNHIPSNQLLQIPIPVSQAKAAHDQLVKRVDSILGLNRQLASAKSEAQREAIQRQIEATDAEIDRLVYDLYGLTKKELAIVEGGEGATTGADGPAR